MLFCAGLPVFFLEMALGQYAGVGPIKIFGLMTPLLKGLGYAMVSVGVLLAFFYNVVVSWALWYLCVSFASLLVPDARLEWAFCGHSYNTKCCHSQIDDDNCVNNGTLRFIALNGSCQSATLSSELLQCNLSSSVEEYWDRHVLSRIGYDWSNYGVPRVQNVAALFFAWILIALCLLKGVKSSGRVSYITSFLPYLILTILAARSFTLPGASEGIMEYFKPQWSKLLTMEIWVDAATQIIFSLGPACGCVITLSSYNQFHRDCQLDAVAIAVANGLTSITGGCVVFAILGYMAHDTGRPISEVVQGGPGLAFLAYPEVVTKMISPSLMATLFFAMLISLALGSIFGAFETVITALSDQWPVLRDYKPQLVTATAFTMAWLGLSFTCPGGIHMFTLFNEQAPSWNLLVFALLEVVIVSWIYGIDTFIGHIEEMKKGMHPALKIYWKVSLKYITPAVLAVLLIMEFSIFGHVRYEKYVYPTAIQLLGYCITGSSLVWIPIFMYTEHRKSLGHQDAAGNHKSTSTWLLKPTSVTQSIKSTMRLTGFLHYFRTGAGKKIMAPNKIRANSNKKLSFSSWRN